MACYGFYYTILPNKALLFGLPCLVIFLPALFYKIFKRKKRRKYADATKRYMENLRSEIEKMNENLRSIREKYEIVTKSYRKCSSDHIEKVTREHDYCRNENIKHYADKKVNSSKHDLKTDCEAKSKYLCKPCKKEKPPELNSKIGSTKLIEIEFNRKDWKLKNHWDYENEIFGPITNEKGDSIDPWHAKSQFKTKQETSIPYKHNISTSAINVMCSVCPKKRSSAFGCQTSKEYLEIKCNTNSIGIVTSSCEVNKIECECKKHQSAISCQGQCTKSKLSCSVSSYEKLTDILASLRRKYECKLRKVDEIIRQQFDMDNCCSDNHTMTDVCDLKLCCGTQTIGDCKDMKNTCTDCDDIRENIVCDCVRRLRNNNNPCDSYDDDEDDNEFCEATDDDDEDCLIENRDVCKKRSTKRTLKFVTMETFKKALRQKFKRKNTNETSCYSEPDECGDAAKANKMRRNKKRCCTCSKKVSCNLIIEVSSDTIIISCDEEMTREFDYGDDDSEQCCEEDFTHNIRTSITHEDQMKPTGFKLEILPNNCT